MSNELTTTEPMPREMPVLADMRELILGTDSTQIAAGLKEYGDRRKMFRDWLRKQLIEGVHYGTPPGCEPKVNEKGEVGIWTKGKDGERGGYKWYPKEQWTPKPSLYKAGADFVVELMNVRDEYTADMPTWEQLGKPQGTFVMSCRLYSRATGELLGEGRGVRKVGQKGGDENNAIKMAKKSAKVDAVLNCYGLSDLFTQDIEDMPPPGPAKHENPAANPTAPSVKPRGERVTTENLRQLYTAWRTFHEHDDTPESKRLFIAWQEPITGIPADVAHKPENWTTGKVSECYGRLNAS
ncbi:MAG: hypothetical protein E6Q97_18315 [Desulfurellales bacterium]|nr:MAG: hypothetical protein E6Q97_18315 [Desulfurellales bacterium]